MSEEAGDVSVTALGAGRFLVTRGGQQRLDTRTLQHCADEQASLAAPMPATVVAIAVRPGQKVAAGDVLIRLEAMKMELPVRSPRDATVVAIKCREGELVQPGVPLLELDEA